jgi:hypothetical protein
LEVSSGRYTRETNRQKRQPNFGIDGSHSWLSLQTDGLVVGPKIKTWRTGISRLLVPLLLLLLIIVPLRLVSVAHAHAKPLREQDSPLTSRHKNPLPLAQIFLSFFKTFLSSPNAARFPKIPSAVLSTCSRGSDCVLKFK